MKFNKQTAEIYVPDNAPTADALARTTHLGIGAHQDDLEFMALHGILECFQSADKWFSGVVVTDGRGSSRTGLYADYSDDQMCQVRRAEQRKAAHVGEYGAMVSLDYPSTELKSGFPRPLVEDFKSILSATCPRFIYTHNPADKHDTHLAVLIPLIEALREMPPGDLPEAVYGCEVWRNLDWMRDEDKTIFDVSHRESLSLSLMGVFDSQISGGKRYDLATYGRMKANATYLASHHSDKAGLMSYAMNLTPLAHDPSLDVAAYVDGLIQKFACDVSDRINKYSKKG